MIVDDIMKPPFETLTAGRAALEPGAFPGETRPPDPNAHVAAMSTERLHTILRRMSVPDWARLKSLLQEVPTPPAGEEDLEVIERLFRKGEPIGGQAGGTVLRIVQAIPAHPALLEEVRAAHERIRARLRFVLREMSDDDWAAFKALMGRNLAQPGRAEDIRVLELVFRVGESVSNIEIAASAKADKLSGPRLLQPEVARRNALMKARTPGALKVDLETVYLAAKQALEKAQEAARRAENTLAYQYVKPTMAYRRARSTVFRTVDAILECAELIAEVGRIEADLTAVQPVSREQMRWALHRMPVADRMQVIKMTPLNTILMFHNGENGTATRDPVLKAARDRRLAYDLFVRGQSDEELTATYGLSLNAVKNAVGVILQTLIEKPLARQVVNDYLARVVGIEPMSINEVRSRLKRLPPERKAEIVNGVPCCAWKQREVMPVHKHLFLDYMCGEWVLGRLVDYYNLEKGKRLTGKFKSDGTLTVRGANAAIEGILSKIAEEPLLRQQLRRWTSAVAATDAAVAESAAEREEPNLDDLMPPGRQDRPFSPTL